MHGGEENARHACPTLNGRPLPAGTEDYMSSGGAACMPSAER